MDFRRFLFDSRAPAATILIRLMVGAVVAVLSTKIPMLLGHGFWGFSPPKAEQIGFWVMAHEARTDFCMLLGGIFLLTVGAGCLSLDASFGRSCCPGEPQHRTTVT